MTTPLQDLPTASVSDALDKLGLPGSIHGIGPLRPGQRACGPAYTVAYEPVDEAGGTVGDFLDDVPPGSVVFIDNDGRTDCTVWGGIMTQVAAHRAALAALRDVDAPARALTAYRHSRDLLVQRLQQVPGMSCPVPAGGMFAFPDVRRLVADGPWDSSVDLASWLLAEAHVAVVPGEVFGAEGHLRISFAVDPARLDEAADNWRTP